MTPEPTPEDGTPSVDLPLRALQNDDCRHNTAGAGQENAELEWARRHVPDDPATLFVERKTELLGWGVPAHKRARYLTAEAMVEQVVLPVLERMQRDLLRRIEALDARINTLEAAYAGRKKPKQSADETTGSLP